MIRFLDFLHWLYARRPAAPGKRRALLRLLATAIEQRIEPAPLLAAWTRESRGRWRAGVARLGRMLDRGVSLPDAIERQPNLLSDEESLLVRFAHESGTLAGSLKAYVNAPPADDELYPIDPGGHLKATVIVSVLVGSFCLTFVVPSFLEITTEFGIPVPPQVELLDDAGVLMQLALLAVLLWAFFARLLRVLDTPVAWLRRHVLGRISPAARSRRIAGVLRRLGDSAKAGKPVSGGLATLARHHYDPSVRRRLLKARNEVGLGTPCWEAFAGVGLLTRAERRVLQATEHTPALGWSLHALADVRERRADTLRRAARFFLRLMFLSLLAAIVFAAGWLVITTLNVLTLSLA